MEEKSKILYDALYASKSYTKTYEEFKQQFSTPEAISTLHGVLQSKKTYTKTLPEFEEQFFSDVKKKGKSESTSEDSSTSSELESPSPSPDAWRPFDNSLTKLAEEGKLKESFFKNSIQSYADAHKKAKDYIVGGVEETVADSPVQEPFQMPVELSESLVKYENDLAKRQNSFGLTDVYKPTKDAAFHEALATAFDNSYKGFFDQRRKAQELKLFDHNGEEITAEDAATMYPGLLENPNFFKGLGREFFGTFVANFNQSLADLAKISEPLSSQGFARRMVAEGKPTTQAKVLAEEPTIGDVLQTQADKARGLSLKFAPMTEGILGNAVKTGIAMSELGLELALTRRGVGLNHVQALYTQMVGTGSLSGALRPEDYGADNPIMGSLKAAEMRFEEATLLSALGYGSQLYGAARANAYVKKNAERLLQTELKGKTRDVAVASSMGMSMVGFGGMSAMNQWRYNGEVDWNKVGGDMLAANGLRPVGILPKLAEKSYTNYFSADLDTKNWLRSNIDNVEAIRERQLELITTAREGKTKSGNKISSQVAIAMEMQANMLGNLADIKAMDELVGKNPNVFIKSIKESGLPKEQQDAMILQVLESKAMENSSFETGKLIAEKQVVDKRIMQIERIANNLEKDSEARSLAEYDVEKQQLATKSKELDTKIKEQQEIDIRELTEADFLKFKTTKELQEELKSYETKQEQAPEGKEVKEGQETTEKTEVKEEVDRFKLITDELASRESNGLTEGETGNYIFGNRAYNDVRQLRLDLKKLPEEMLTPPSRFSDNVLPELLKEIDRRNPEKKERTASDKKEDASIGEPRVEQKETTEFVADPVLEKQAVESFDKLVKGQAEEKLLKEKAKKTGRQKFLEQVVNKDEYLKQQFLKEGVKKRSVREWLADRIVDQESPWGRYVVETINAMKGASFASQKQVEHYASKIFGNWGKTMSQGEQKLVYDIANLQHMSEMQKLTEKRNAKIYADIDAKTESAKQDIEKRLADNIARINETRDKKIEAVNNRKGSQAEKRARIDEINKIYDSYVDKATKVSEESLAKLPERAAEIKKKKTVVRKEEQDYQREVADYTLAAFQAKDPVVLEKMLTARGLKEVDVERVMQSAHEFQQAFKESSFKAYEAGLISDATLHEWLTERPFYSPDRYYEHVNNNQSVYRNSVKPYKAAGEGSTGAKLNDPFQLLNDHISRVNAAIAYNNSLKSIAEFADANPNNEFVKRSEIDPEYYNKLNNKKSDTFIEKFYKEPKTGWMNIEFRENGEKSSVQMPIKLAEEITTPESASFQMNVWKWGTGVKPVMLSATTYNPVFGMITNNIMDPVTQWLSTDAWHWSLPGLVSQQMKGVKANLLDAVKYHMPYSEDPTRPGVSSYMEKGGGMGGISTEGLIKTRYGYHSPASQYITAINDILSSPASISEVVWRTSLRDRYLEKYVDEYTKAAGQKPDDATMKRLEQSAVMSSRRYLDFAEGGATVKVINALQPFFSAGVNVTRSVLRSAKNDPLLFTAKISQLAAAKVAMTSWNMGHYIGDDDERNKMRDAYLYDVPDYIKRDNFVLMLPKPFTDKNGAYVYPYVKIPLDNMVAPIASLAEEVYIRTSHDPKHEILTGKNVIDLLSVLQPYAKAGQASPIAGAFLSYATNKNLFTFDDIWKKTNAGNWTSDLSQEYTLNTPKNYVSWGEKTGMSPERTKVAVSNIIAINNSFAYNFRRLMKADDPLIDNQSWFERAKAGSSAANKVLGITYPGADVRAVDEATKIEKSLDVNAMRTEIDKMINDGADFSNSNIHDYISAVSTTTDDEGNANVDWSLYQGLMERATDRVIRKTGSKVPPEIYNFLYTTAETKAAMWLRYTEAFKDDPEKMRALLEGAAKTGFLSEATMRAYIPLKNAHEAEKRRLQEENNQ